MANGCIIGECYICGDWVFEDERSWYNDRLKLATCKTKSLLKQENELLRRELEEYKKWFGGKEDD